MAFAKTIDKNLTPPQFWEKYLLCRKGVINEVWKGVVGFLCGLYLLYYAFAEYTGDNKMIVILVMLLGSVVGGGLMGMGAAMAKGP